jgi:hypothetical protein
MTDQMPPPEAVPLVASEAAVPPPQAAGPVPPVSEKKPRNTLGLIAMIVAIVGFVFACIPGALILGWILLPIGFILGLVAVFQKGKGKWQAVTAIILSVVGTIVGAIVFVSVVAGAVDDALSDGETTISTPTDEGEAATDEDTPEAEPVADVGTRENPVPLGTEIANDEWKVVVNSVTFAATDAVLAENMFNEEPVEGNEYILVNYTVTYVGDDANGQMPAFVTVNFVTADGVTIDGTDSLAVAPDAIDTMTTLYSGGSVSGNAALSVPSATAQDGALVVSPGMLADKVFVAVR